MPGAVPGDRRAPIVGLISAGTVKTGAGKARSRSTRSSGRPSSSVRPCDLPPARGALSTGSARRARCRGTVAQLPCLMSRRGTCRDAAGPRPRPGGRAASVTVSATSSAGSATQAFVLTVNGGLAITSARSATATSGAAFSLTVTSTGTPTPTLTHTGATRRHHLHGQRQRDGHPGRHASGHGARHLPDHLHRQELDRHDQPGLPADSRRDAFIQQRGGGH